MAESDFFDRIHGPATPEDVVGLYDDWAERYDADVGGVRADPACAVLFEEDGAHLPARDLTCRVFVLAST